MNTSMSIVIPTYRRPLDLNRLLNSIYYQTVSPEQVVIVIGPDDIESNQVISQWNGKLKCLLVVHASKPSVVHAMNLGISHSIGDIVSFVDDDAWLPGTWCSVIKNAFSNDYFLGAYGGPDYLQIDDPQFINPSKAELVGKFRWDGYLVGNHHLGVEKSPANVDVLKGVNLSFRRGTFKNMLIEPALESQGAEVAWEIDLCQHIALCGYKIVYDNKNYLLHYVGERSPFDNRNDLFSPAWPRRLYNNSLVISKYRPIYSIILHTLRTFLVGNKFQPGLILSILLVRKHGVKIIGLSFRNISYIYNGIVHGIRLRRSLNVSN